MFKKKKESRPQKSEYRAVVAFSKLFSRVFKALYYFAFGAVALCVVVALIILLVNTSVEDMMLPPFMSRLDDGFYSINIGNGIRINTPQQSVTLSDIKTVIYAELIMIFAMFAMIAPISLFLSKLMNNIAGGSLYEAKNGRYTMYMGLSIMVGYTFVLYARQFYNYLLTKTFVSDDVVLHLALGVDLGGIIVGLLIIFFGYMIGYLCEQHNILNKVETAVVESKSKK